MTRTEKNALTHGAIPRGNLKGALLFYVLLALQNRAFFCDVIAGCVVAGCFFLNLHHAHTYALAYSPNWQKQYLIANHIVRFAELPLVGDEVHVFRNLHLTSPLYLYLFAFVLWMHTSILFAQVVWITLSMLAIVCIYLLAKDLFSPVVGLFACALFGFSFAYAAPLGGAPNISIGQALIYLSFLLLARAYSSKDFPPLVWAIASYCVGGVIYVAGFGVLPVFAALVAVTLKKQHAAAKRYVGCLAVAGVTLLAAYLPVIIHATRTHGPLFGSGIEYRVVHTPGAFLKNVLAHAIYSTDTLFLIASRGSVLPPLSDYAALARQLALRGQGRAGIRVTASVVLATFVCASVMGYFLLRTTPPERKRRAGILACGIVAVIFSAAVFNSYIYHATWHYMAVQGLMCILVAEAVHGVCARLRVPRSVELVFACSLVWGFAGGFAGIPALSEKSSISPSYAGAAGEALVRETWALRQELSEPHFRPRIKRYEVDGQFSEGDPYLWTYLETAFQERFVKLSDSVAYGISYYGYEPVGDDRYLFVVCPHTLRLQDCRNDFSRQYAQYASVKEIISNAAYDIVLAKRFSEPGQRRVQ